MTGLPNRRLFATELEGAIGRANAGTTSSAVLLIDLDRFKPVNDIQGHAAGDQVLCEVAHRLGAMATSGQTVARFGGDEFALIVEADGAAVKQQAVDLAERVLAAIRQPVVLGETRIEIGASLGIALCPTDGKTADDMIHAADLAMYRAKKGGCDTFRFFEQSMDDELRAQSVLEDGLRVALRDGTIQPYYQPLIGLNDERICGFEVLARWPHPEHGFVPPDKFVPMAERLGLAADLTAIILRQACRDARTWGEDIRLAVNVSPLQLADRLFPTKLLAILSEEGFDPARLEIEVTESALVGDADLAREILGTLQGLGIGVSLDDFGTGYSSLYHLRNLRFDKLKIDRSFVQSMQTDPESAKIVEAVLGLAKSLGMPVVAEGIEDRLALAHLARRGCDFGQGFYFSRAVPPEAAAELLARSRMLMSA